MAAQGEMASSCSKLFRLDIRKNIFTGRVIKHRTDCLVESPALDVLTKCADVALEDVVWWAGGPGGLGGLVQP